MFADRAEVGRRLARKLQHLRGSDDVVVLGLPRGGVPVAYRAARALHAPLDIIAVRKLGVPFQPELAMGAIGEDGVRVINTGVRRAASIDSTELAAVGGYDYPVIDLNTTAQAMLHCPNRLAIVPGATHLFDEPGTRQASAELARDWLTDHFQPGAGPRR